MPRRTHISAARVARTPRTVAARARIRSTAGFTLGEVLITVLLVGLLTGAVAAGIGTAINVYNDIRGHADAQGILNNAVTAVTDELRYASDISSFTPDGSDYPATYIAGSRTAWAFNSPTRGYRLYLANASENASGSGVIDITYLTLNAVSATLNESGNPEPLEVEGPTTVRLPLLNTAANSGDSSATGNAYNVQLTQLSWDSSTRLWQFKLEVTSADGSYTTNTGDTPITVRALNTW